MTTDKPTIDFNLDAAIKEAGGEPFRFVFEGKPVEITRMGALPVSVIEEAAENPDQLVQALVMFREALGAELWERVRKVLPAKALERFGMAYAEHSGMDVGEAPASSS